MKPTGHCAKKTCNADLLYGECPVSPFCWFRFGSSAAGWLEKLWVGFQSQAARGCDVERFSVSMADPD